MTTNTFNTGIKETMAVIVQHGSSLVKVEPCCAGWVLIGSTCRSLGSHLKEFGLSCVSGTTDTSCINLSKKWINAWQGPLVGRAELFPDSCRTMTAAFVFAHCVLDGLLLSSPLFHLTLEYKQCGRTTNKEGDIWPVMDDLSNSVYSISKGMCCILCVTVQTVYMKYCIKSSLILLLHVMV